MSEAKLQNPGFVQKAPAALVEKEREKLARLHEALKNLSENLAKLQ